MTLNTGTAVSWDNVRASVDSGGGRVHLTLEAYLHDSRLADSLRDGARAKALARVTGAGKAAAEALGATPEGKEALRRLSHLHAAEAEVKRLELASEAMERDIMASIGAGHNPAKVQARQATTNAELANARGWLDRARAAHEPHRAACAAALGAASVRAAADLRKDAADEMSAAAQAMLEAARAFLAAWLNARALLDAARQESVEEAAKAA